MVGVALNRSVVARIGSSLGRGYEASRIAMAAASASTWVRNSWLYGWLTVEPEPDVIVIDLRETWTVGPLISALDRIVPKVAVVARESVLLSATRWSYRAVSRPLAGSRFAQWCAAALSPPEPPDERDEKTSDEQEAGSAGDRQRGE